MLDTGPKKVRECYEIVSTNGGIETPRSVGKAIFCLISAGKKEFFFIKNCCFASYLVFVETIPIQ